jgi:hypothetical protein
MPSSSEDLTFAKITSEENGRKTVNLKTTKTSNEAISRCLKGIEAHSCTKESIPDLTLPYLGYVEDADTKADVMKDAICVLCVQLVRESLLWGRPNWEGCIGILSCCAGESERGKKRRV